MYLTEHQRSGPCPMCQDDASTHNHCAYCGRTFDTFNELSEHLDGCDDMRAVMGGVDQHDQP